ncbi:DUF3159 domain-containing protein [Georgenia sp. 10Sc9-8]|uniref:DUF3159 domain-containing protein n=1 Tax=Georgenia halotolerans TaxID=3028317 RepID=A0ABT5U0G7_9MICO|nr:DUF3159 domain-containing protein [Georgenia halotolerans]
MTRATGPGETPEPGEVGTSPSAQRSPEDGATAPLEARPEGGAAPPADEPAAGGATPPGSGVRQLLGEDFSLSDTVGGVRGMVEAMAPGLLFVVVFIATRDLVPALVASVAVAVGAMVARLVARTPLTQALSGLLGVGVGVVWAWRTGQAEDYFAFGLWTNAAYAAGLLLALVFRWPAVGVVVAALRGQDMSWRTDPAQRGRYARYRLATWLWVLMFLARLAVQVPLYLSAEVGWLGTARLVMGLPLWGLTLWATWVLVREPTSAEAR